MSYRIQQSTTAYKLMFLMVQSSDHVTGLTGASPTVTLSKNGAAFASPSGAVSELANGWYLVAGNATDSNTLGPLALHATAASGDPSDTLYEVVAQDLTTATIALVTTVTTVTNQLTAAAIATGVWQDATAGDFTTASSIGKSLYTGNHAPGAASGLPLVGSSMDVSSINSVSTSPVTTVKAVIGLTTADTIATYTGNTPQTGDAFARIGAAGAGLTNLGDTRIANLDAAVSSRSTYAGGAVASVTGNVGGNVVGSVASVTAGVTVTTNNDKTGYELDATGSAAFTESYAPKGATATLPQLLYSLLQALTEFSTSGTTITVKKRNQATTAFTATVDNATTPTAITQAT
jgi:hypothetical protein